MDDQRCIFLPLLLKKERKLAKKNLPWVEFNLQLLIVNCQCLWAAALFPREFDDTRPFSKQHGTRYRRRRVGQFIRRMIGVNRNA